MSDSPDGAVPEALCMQKNLDHNKFSRLIFLNRAFVEITLLLRFFSCLFFLKCFTLWTGIRTCVPMEKMALLSSTAQTLVDQLVKQFDQGQLAQAYVFYGSNLSGHLMAAHILAEKVLTHGPQMPGGFPAEVTAKFIANETHPNFFVLKPEADKTEITVEGARSFNTFLQSTATLSGWRVALIEPADRLNTAASNALLKSLEELPSKVTVVLIAESLHSIKQTILSRTQKVFFHKQNQKRKRSSLPLLGQKSF